ncbi:MAG TPA: hypothetical protein VF534_01190 [Paraburkholderia sp.]
MRHYRYELVGAVNPFLELRPDGRLVIGEEEAEAFNELDAATREDVYDVIVYGARQVEIRIREVIA